jgi:hypothetical protein
MTVASLPARERETGQKKGCTFSSTREINGSPITEEYPMNTPTAFYTMTNLSASADNPLKEILYSARVTGLIEGLESALDYISAIDADHDDVDHMSAASAIEEACDFLCDLR